jgi:hypothetical protein
MLKEFKESEHPRYPPGSPKGGQFAPANGLDDTENADDIDLLELEEQGRGRVMRPGWVSTMKVGNPYHKPKGPGGGQFTSGPGGVGINPSDTARDAAIAAWNERNVPGWSSSAEPPGRPKTLRDMGFYHEKDEVGPDELPIGGPGGTGRRYSRPRPKPLRSSRAGGFVPTPRPRS